MRLYVEPMDSVVIEARADGCVLIEHEDWSRPTLQERRAIIDAAQREIEELAELLEFLSLEAPTPKS